jgi:hypothetical protein
MSSPGSDSGPAPLRRRGAERLVVVLAAAALLLLVIGGIAAVVAMPVRRAVIYGFAAPDAGDTPVNVYLGGKLVGRAPLTFDYEELEPYFDPEFDPTNWPPQGYSGSSISASGSFRSEVFTRSADPGAGRNENVIYMKTVEAGRTRHAALRVLVKAGDGRIGVYCGSASSTTGSWKRESMIERLSFRLRQPAGAGQERESPDSGQ